jgi:enolase
MYIKKVHAREILDSRGNPTIEADIILENNLIARASVPSGASTGSREAVELRDHDMQRYLGKGVLIAVNNINTTINSALLGHSVLDQEALDARLCKLDGSENKKNLGANAILAVSLAAARARSMALGVPLYTSLQQPNSSAKMPVPMMNILNGGAHADNNMDIQECMIMPVGASNFAHAIQIGVEIFHNLKQLLKRHGLNSSIGDEGGFAPQVKSNNHALDLLLDAIAMAKLSLYDDVVLALDVAASELYQDGAYHLKAEGSSSWSGPKLVEYYINLCKQYPILSIEDGLDEKDWDNWRLLTESMQNKVQLVGDDLFVTNHEILQKGIDNNIANAILIKPNQIGTLSETLQTMKLATKNNYKCIVSHRSGETEDTFIADLAVATGCGQIKTGSVCRTDRTAKYNELLRIYEETSLAYAGQNIFKTHATINAGA